MEALISKYKKTIVPGLKDKLGLKTIMEVPRLEKIVLNIGMGSAVTNPKGLEVAVQELSTITGQRAVKTYARKSIAGFKVREGMPLGAMVTLRGQQMFEFLERLIYVALPRVRDFKGLSPKSFDGRGNYNLSIKEQIIFPEIDVDKVDSYHGLNVTMVTTAKEDDPARELLSELGMPFRK
ncbi:MAG: 50S ribosomal protein L5 [Leptospiraceae bacterium]|nr:50S ribosomal protein L5 [Leptospiraceae bacterium]MCB1316350.1 50S ribosomal protein L5 [Leptospiraceae bacterium]MCB1322569.1 50S ribosomal protein L5 [Leptospiraceae bacterium]